MIAERFIGTRRLARKAGKLYQHLIGRQKTTYVWDRVPFYRQIWAEAAKNRGLSFVELSDDFWELRDASDQPVARMNNCYLELDNPVVLHLAGEKALTYKLLENKGLPVARHAVFTLDNLSTLKSFLQHETGPFVIKPEGGTSSGMGVTTNLREYRECIDAAILASLYSKKLLIETFVPGEVYRLLIVGGRMISAVRREGLWMTGDGKTRLQEQVANWFQQGSLEHTPGRWESDHDLHATTSVQGLGPQTIVEAGRRVLVKSVAESSQDNEEVRTIYNEDVSNLLHPRTVEQACLAATTLRSEFCGVDLILLDASKALGPDNGVIGEVNTTPGLHHHYRVAGSGDEHTAADAVLEYYFSKPQRINK